MLQDVTRTVSSLPKTALVVLAVPAVTMLAEVEEVAAVDVVAPVAVVTDTVVPASSEQIKHSLEHQANFYK